MAVDTEILKAVVFDYGNTIIEFGHRQMEMQHSRLAEFLENLVGPCDRDLLSAIRSRQIVAAYGNEYRENDTSQICSELIEELYGRAPSAGELDQLQEMRYRIFLDAVTLPRGVLPVLQALRKRFRLAMISNYPSGRAIRGSLKKIGIDHIFEIVVVSGDVGYIKPHPLPFSRALDGLGLQAEECLYVGDNWLADVQGAKRAGWQAVHTVQYVPYERFDPCPGDEQPDARIERFGELAQMLL